MNHDISILLRTTIFSILFQFHLIIILGSRLLRFKEDFTSLLLRINATFCEDFWQPKNIRPKISALNVRPRNKKSQFSPLCFLLSGFSMWCIKFYFWKKLKTGEVRFIRVIKEKKYYFEIITGPEKLKIWLVQSNVHCSCCTQPCADKTSTLWYCLGKTEWLGQS